MAPIRCCFDQTAVWHSDAARGPSTPSLDHLVGKLLQMQGHIEAKHFGGLEVDDQLELAWRLHWKIGRLLAPKNTVDVSCRWTPLFDLINPIGEQPARAGEESERINRRQPMPRSQFHD